MRGDGLICAKCLNVLDMTAGLHEVSLNINSDEGCVSFGKDEACRANAVLSTGYVYPQ